MVTNSAALETVVNGPDGLLVGLGPGKIVIDMSTVGPAVSRAIAVKVREKGADMVDAPVLGSLITLEQGKLSVMVGGRKPSTETKPILDDVGPEGDADVGDNGLALVMKIASNPELRRADARVFGGRAAGGKERHPKDETAVRRAHAQRDDVPMAVIADRLSWRWPDEASLNAT